MGFCWGASLQVGLGKAKTCQPESLRGAAAALLLPLRWHPGGSVPAAGMWHPRRCLLLCFQPAAAPGAAPAPREHSDTSLSSPHSARRAGSSFGAAFDAGVSAGSQQCTDPPRTLLGTPRLSQTHYPCTTHPSCLPSLDLLSGGAEPRGQGRESCPPVPLIAPSPAHASRVLGFTAGLSPPSPCLGGCPHPWQPPREQL